MKFLELCREYKNEYFSAPEISGKASFLSRSNVYRYLEKLQDNFFDVDNFIDSYGKNVKKYRLRPVVNMKIPTFDEIMGVIEWMK